MMMIYSEVPSTQGKFLDSVISLIFTPTQRCLGENLFDMNDVYNGIFTFLDKILPAVL